MQIIANIIIAGLTVFGSVFAAKTTASSEAGTQVKVIEEREKNHYEEVTKQLDRIDKKLDQLIDSKLAKKPL